MNSIKNSVKFDSIVKELVSSLFNKKLKEITTTASIDAYQTPYAFGKKLHKKRKKDIEKQTGYKFIDEALSDNDMKNIKKEILELHIAHNEGNYFCSEDEIKSLEDNNQIAVTYCNENGNDNDENNPNGAIKNIAGILNDKKNVLGMMPHPERMIDKYLSGEDGSLFFENLIGNLK